MFSRFFTYLCGMETKNKDLIESYKLVTARDTAGIGLYGQRLIIRLVEFATAGGATQGLDFSSGRDVRRVEVGLWGERSVTMPLTDLMSDTSSSTNYTAVKRSIRALQGQRIEYEEKEGVWVSFPFIGRAQIADGHLTVKVEPELWQVFVDFRAGFRRYELEVALKLKSTYSLRIYKYISEQHDPDKLKFSIDDLKKMLGVGDKYNKASDFIKYVLEPAQRELNNIAPWTFTIKKLTSRKVKTGRDAITGIQFFPVFQPEHRDPNLERTSVQRQNARYLAPLKGEARKMLLQKFGFTDKGLVNNRELFLAAAKYLNLLEVLDRIAVNVANTRPANVPGYVVGALKMELAAQGVDTDFSVKNK